MTCVTKFHVRSVSSQGTVTRTPPNLSNTGSFENYFKQMKAGYRITKDNQTVTLSLEEMNRFENEVCDFVELKLKHLFKQKGVAL